MQPEEFDPLKHPRRLNLGCGFDHRAGYVNVDFQAFHNPDLVADVGQLDFLPAGFYEELLAQDVLEHLPRTSTRRILAHWNRLLAVGGTLHLRVPNALAILRQLADRANNAVAKQEELIQILFGTQAYSGDFHYTSFTETLLQHYLKVTGFEVVAITQPDAWNLDAVGRKVRGVSAHDVGDFSDLLQIRSDEDFVRECYLVVLRREADAEGRQFFATSLAKATLDRRGVLDAMIRSDEYRARVAGNSA
jgi:predicted SAM-dependent methyltransferase